MHMFACPACHGTLKWNIMEQRVVRIEAAEALCTACGAVYPVREGIGLFLTPDLPRNDLWESLLFRRQALQQFTMAGWQAELTNACKPTDRGSWHRWFACGGYRAGMGRPGCTSSCKHNILVS